MCSSVTYVTKFSCERGLKIINKKKHNVSSKVINMDLEVAECSFCLFDLLLSGFLVGLYKCLVVVRSEVFAKTLLLPWHPIIKTERC